MVSVLTLTMSYSAWIGFFCSAALSSWVAKRPTLNKCIWLALIVLFLVANSSYLLGAMKLTDYLAYMANVWKRYFFQTLDNPLWGRGLTFIGGPKTFLESDVQEAYSLRDIDSGWIGLVIRLGYPIALALASAVALVFVTSLQTIRRRHRNIRKLSDVMVPYAAAVPALFATLFSFHTLPWERFGLDINFFIFFAAASLIGRESLVRNEYQDAQLPVKDGIVAEGEERFGKWSKGLVSG